MLFTKLLLEKSFLRILGFQRWTRRTRDRQILAKVEVLVNAVATSYKIINWKFLPSLTNSRGRCMEVDDTEVHVGQL